MLMGNSRSVNVRREELLTILKSNLEKHRSDFAISVAGYQQVCIDTLKQELKKVQKGIDESLSVYLTYPESHEDAYVEVIEMLEMSVDETIQLDSSAFRSYVKDEWSWSNNFKMLNSTYAAGANR